MRYKFSYPVSGRLSSALLIALLASASSACSSGVTRFNESPFSNPFEARHDKITTGSVRAAQSAKTSVSSSVSSARSTATNYSRITSTPLPAPGTSQAKALAATATSSAAGKVTMAKEVAGWSAKGGTPVTLGAGETAQTIANRYGVPASALLSANGLSNSSQMIPGQRLIVPAYSAVSGGSSGITSGVSGMASDAASKAKDRAMSGAMKKVTPALLSKSLSELKNIPAAMRISSSYFAFSHIDDAKTSDEVLPAELLAFTDSKAEIKSQAIKKVAAPVAKTAQKPASAKRVRAVSSIAAPISIASAPRVAAVPVQKKPVIQAALAKPVVAKPATTIATRVKVAVAPLAAKKPVIIAAAPKNPIIRTVAAKPSIIVSQKPLKQAPDAPLTTSKVKQAPIAKVVAAKPAIQKTTMVKPVAKKAVAVKPVAVKTAAAKPVANKAKIAAMAAPVSVVGVAAGVSKTDAKEIDVKKLDTNVEPQVTGSLPPHAEALNEDKGLFRWPVRGRVISAFGAKELSGTNNGINIAVPEGTPVKAAEAGTVAYSGDDVKKYGKLVLIKHENGYVSAYAHNGELNVKKGEPVKRGQIIAKSGATGDVASPQLHFQLRKGEQPLDPSKLLDAS